MQFKMKGCLYNAAIIRMILVFLHKDVKLMLEDFSEHKRRILVMP